MANSTSGTLKALIESLGLGLSAYRDSPPEDTAVPYATVHERITLDTDESGDNGADPTGTEVAQVDLWQQYRDPTTKALTESYTLSNALHVGIHGATVANVGAKRVYGCRVLRSVRQLERDTNLVHDSFDVELRRAI